MQPAERKLLSVQPRILDRFVLGPPCDRGPLWKTHHGWDCSADESLLRIHVVPTDGKAAATDVATVLESLLHPAIAPVIASGSDGDAFCIVVPEIVGQSLAERIAQFAPVGLGVLETGRVVHQMAAVLAWLHRKQPQIVHEALSPQRIFLALGVNDVRIDAAGVMHVARRVASDSATFDLSYAAPEQLEARRPVGPPTDQFLLASIAFECLTGRRAFTDDDSGRRAIVNGIRPWVDGEVTSSRPGINRVLQW